MYINSIKSREHDGRIGRHNPCVVYSVHRPGSITSPCDCTLGRREWQHPPAIQHTVGNKREGAMFSCGNRDVTPTLPPSQTIGSHRKLIVHGGKVFVCAYVGDACVC